MGIFQMWICLVKSISMNNKNWTWTWKSVYTNNTSDRDYDYSIMIILQILLYYGNAHTKLFLDIPVYASHHIIIKSLHLLPSG